MPHCIYCGQFVMYSQDLCPYCALPAHDERERDGREVSGDDFNEEHDAIPDDIPVNEHPDNSLTTIARFTNAAEAGYFAHELKQEEQISVQLKIDESFDAVGGHWKTHYLLLVPEEVAVDSASALQALVQRHESEDGWDFPYLSEEESQPPTSRLTAHEPSHFEVEGEPFSEEPGLNWVPIVLTLAAGSIAFWAYRKFPEQPQPAALAAPGEQKTEELLEVLTEEPTPWIQISPDGQERRVMQFNPKDRLVIVREDDDGDGLFEKKQEFEIPQTD